MAAPFMPMTPEEAKAQLLASQQPNSFQFFGGLAPVVAAGALDTPATLYGLAQSAYSAPREGESFFERATRHHDRFPFGKQTGALYEGAQDFASSQGLNLPVQIAAEVATPLPSLGKAKAATAALGALAASPLVDTLRALPDFTNTLPEAFTAALGGLFHGTPNKLQEVPSLGRVGPDMSRAKDGKLGQGFYADTMESTARGYVTEGTRPGQVIDGGVYGMLLDADERQLLDLATPLSAQNAEVARILAREGLDDVPNIMGRQQPIGRDVYMHLEEILGSQAAATEFLRKAGIPGGYIEHSGGARHVVFDPEIAYVDPRNTDPDLIGGLTLGAPSRFPTSPQPIVPVPRRLVQAGQGPAAGLRNLEELQGINQGAYTDPSTGVDLTGRTLAPGATVDATSRKYLGVVDDTVDDIKAAGGGTPVIDHNLLRPEKYDYIGKDGVPRRLTHSIATLESSRLGKGNPARNAKGEGYTHAYANEVEYRVPSLMRRDDNRPGEPHLRPRAHGDIYGIGDAGEIKTNGNVHPLYEKLVVVPKGEDPGIKGAKLLTGDKAPRPSKKYTAVVPSVRHLEDHAEAIEVARSEPHLIKASRQGEKSGVYVGSPNTVQSKADLDRMRDEYDALVELGQSIPGVGPDWYKRIGANWKRIAPGRETLAADEFAMFSPQATPRANFDFQIQAHNAYEQGVPKGKVKTTGQAEQYKTYRETGDPDFSLKTGPFSQASDPNRSATIGGTHDIWDARAWGYEGKAGEDWAEGLTENQHRFMDYETVLAVERANQKKLGGRSNWTADEIQASTWVAMGGKDRLAKFDGDIEAAMRSMGETDDFIPKAAFHSTYEVIPDAAGTHLSGVADLDEAARADFSNHPARSYTSPTTGLDMIYQAMGPYSLPTEQGIGAFMNPKTKQLELNPNFDARPIVAFEKTPYRKGSQVDESNQKMLRAAEGLRGAIDYQSGGAGHKSFRIGDRGTTSGDALGFGIDHGRLDSSQQAALQKVLKDQGLTADPYIPMARPESTVISKAGQIGPFGLQYPFDTDLGALNRAANRLGDRANLRQAKAAEKRLTGALGDAGIPATVDRRAVDSVYVDYSDAHMNPGQGMQTRQLQQLFSEPETQALVAKIDASQELRDNVAARMRQNAIDSAAMGDTVDPAQQNFLDIFSKEGLSGVFKALEQGKLLPAVVLPMLIPMMTDLERDGLPQAA